MSKLGYASPREVNGTVVKVPVRWLQQAINAWDPGIGTERLVVDGVWGPNTQAKAIAMVSALRPASLTTLRASDDRRYAYIDVPLEQRLVSLEIGSSVWAPTRPPADTGGTPLVAPPAELEPVSAGTPVWAYWLGFGTFVLGVGVTYAIVEHLAPKS